MSKVREITDSDFQSALESEATVLVDFSASWCGPCKALAPTIDAVATEYDGRLHVYKVDIEQAPEAAARYGVSSVPTCVFFKGGKEVDRFIGNQDLRSIKDRVEKVV